ncbi:hypothetical protein PLICRDRAFT_51905 [Plicaturopsis crispa FD-325 SS-3]|nr:hypothetical protein PLICRDRAFT_51905 [Plicaturopsis crispa FD-325 SS-3]
MSLTFAPPLPMSVPAPPTTPYPTSPQDSRMSVGTISGILLGTILAVVILLLIIWRTHALRRLKRQPTHAVFIGEDKVHVRDVPEYDAKSRQPRPSGCGQRSSSSSNSPPPYFYCHEWPEPTAPYETQRFHPPCLSPPNPTHSRGYCVYYDDSATTV